MKNWQYWGLLMAFFLSKGLDYAAMQDNLLRPSEGYTETLCIFVFLGLLCMLAATGICNRFVYVWSEVVAKRKSTKLSESKVPLSEEK